MARSLNDSPYLYGLHDPGGESLMAQAGAKGWILFTEELGSDPNHRVGRDFSQWADAGYGIMVRLNNGYEPNGTIPRSSKYQDFGRRVANFVAASRGCHIWIIGNEPNYSVERPGVALDWSSNPPRIVTTGEVITPKLYAACYKLCRTTIKGLAGHANDQVVTAAVAPWNIQTTYSGNPSGDWLTYQRDLLAELGPSGCDAISIHAYTHGADPNLIHTNATMDPPFSDHQYNFRVYQDFLNAIPAEMRHLPVYLTEADQNDAWQNVNRGWIQRAYGEIDWWNRLAGTQVIRALILYRWPNIDRWGMEGKTALYEDFRQAMAHKYSWEAAVAAKPSAPPVETGVNKPSFVDITNQLSRNSAGYVKRTAADIKYIVINHTGVRPEIGADLVANAQRQRWPGILSQFFVTGDGKLQRTNADTDVVSRDQAWIFNGINIYVAGNFDATVPSDAQLAVLAQLVAWLLDQYNLAGDAVKGVSEFISTHSPGLQWLDGAHWKDKLLQLVAAVPGSPTASEEELIKELQAEIEQLKAQVQSLTSQVNQLGTDKAALAVQVAALRTQNDSLAQQLKSLTTANASLQDQLKTAAADKQALQKQVADLQARIAELTKTGGGKTATPPAIRDVIATLPKHATLRYDTRNLSQITTLAIHHSAAGGDIPPQNVAAYHVRKDWPGMGYHFYIMGDGTIYQCNSLETISYHVGYANTYSVGICLAGRFMDGTQPPDVQLAATTNLVAYLSQKLNVKLENVKGHKELPQTGTACPGDQWIAGVRWKDRLLALVQAKLK
jgi:N-acetyl-anhydromuramyl-L-alanine amidase AmpD